MTKRQVVKSNATFNAFLLADHPRVQREPIKVAMTRELVLEDDMKEYWAFYLLQGSSVTVSTCCRWPGASLIVIRGHKHLHECAYIGDDSSEELEEMQANLPEGQRPVFKNGTPVPVDDGESNEPDQMKRVRPGVILHGQEVESHEILEGVDVETDIDTVLAQYLRRGGNGRSKALSMALPRSNETKKHTTRDNVSIKTPDDARGMHASNSTEDYLLESETGESHDKEKNITTDISEAVKTTNVAPKSREIESEDAPSSPTAVPSSSEVFEEVLRKIRQLGSRGKGVLQRLNDQLSSPEEDESDNGTEERKLLRQMILDLMQEQQEDEEPAKARKRKRKHKNQTDKASNKTEEWLAESEGGDKNRERRQVYLNPGDLEDLLGMNDEDSDAAIEEGLSPDGIADHHVTLNETTLNDMSKSEFWSSFSSSEEALLSCAGLIVNLPLTPHHKCVRGRNKHELHMASHPNTLTYRVPVNGYYFFIFNSENEIQPNYIHVKFNLDKVVYNVSEPLAACQNSTVDCILPLNFFSSEKVVIELPIRNNDSLWNEEYVVVTTCEPRTALYLGCVIAVPLLILMFAFQ
uniref:Uncharacterized protein n=1 Tax=Timema cristinae TaxID=61476 RepID=A0A7R9CR56_TIMCR|nr:unnamed protein product [Timema cristinae]